MRAKESRPAGDGAAISDRVATGALVATLADSVELRAGYAVHVLSTCANGVQRGQTYASLLAASKKVDRQRQRGLPVQATLVRLVPLPWSVIGEIEL